MNQKEFIKSRLSTNSTGGTNLYLPMGSYPDFQGKAPDYIVIPVDFESHIGESGCRKFAKFFLRDGSKLLIDSLPEFYTFQDWNNPNSVMKGCAFLEEWDKSDWGVDLIYVVRVDFPGQWKSMENYKKLIKLLFDKNIVFFTSFKDAREFGKSVKR